MNSFVVILQYKFHRIVISFVQFVEKIRFFLYKEAITGEIVGCIYERGACFERLQG